MQIRKGSLGGRNVVFDSVIEEIPGGVGLTRARLITGQTEVPAGTLVNVTNRAAQIIKTAKCVADSANGDNVRVEKGHLFKAGESITDGYIVAVISSITTTNADYDILVVATTLVNYATGVVLVEAEAGAEEGVFAKAVITIASGQTIKLVDPTGKSAGITVSIASAGNDTLAVSFTGKTLAIALASTTAASNTPAVEIQAAVRALATTYGIDFSEWVLSGSERAGSAVTPATGVMAANQPLKYVPNGMVKETVNVEEENADCSVVIRGTARESALPYPVNSRLKAALPLFTFSI